MNLYLLIAVVIVAIALLIKEMRRGHYAEYGGDFHGTQIITYRRSSKILLILLIGLFAWFCAERSLVTNDAIPYKNYFDALDVENFFSIDGTYNLCFEFFTKICKVIFGNNYKLYFAIIPVVNCLLIYLIAKRFRVYNAIIFTIAYIAIFGIYYNYIVLRQGMAITMLLVAIYYIKKNKLIGLLFIFVACLFHESAVVGIIIFIPAWIKKIKSKRYFYIVLVIAILLYFTKISDRAIILVAQKILYSGFLSERFNKYLLYLTDIEYTYDISVLHLLNFIMIALFIRCKRNTRWDDFLLHTILIGQVFLGLFSTITAIVRVVDYYMIAYVVMCVKRIMEYNGKSMKILFCIYLIASLAFYVRMVYYMVGFAY